MTQRYRYLQLMEWEVCALLAGTMVQKRVPVGLFHHVPRPGALLWVQEPFVFLEGRGRDVGFELTLYRADAGPAGGFPDQPPETKGRHCRTHVHEPRNMRQGESRFTLEITRAWERPWSYFEVGDREREGLLQLKLAVPHLTLTRAFVEFWRRSYPEHQEKQPVLMMRFRAHKMNVSELLRQRASPSRREVAA